MPKGQLPSELESVRSAAAHAVAPITPAGPNTHSEQDFVFKARRTNAGRSLPPYYLVYFLLVDLLGFRDLGEWEKVAWSIPIDFRGQLFLVDHRKFGVGVFAVDSETSEEAAKEIVACIHRGVSVARPFFDWIARQAVERSHVNVVNNSSELFDRYSYFVDLYRAQRKEAEDRKDERLVEKGRAADGSEWTSVAMPAFRLGVEARWIGISAVDAFFSWTEHVLIHVAILRGVVTAASDVADLAQRDWAAKYKAAIGTQQPRAKQLFDQLVAIRTELRNYVAHGAFGKQGEAFRFHSGAGAVPVLLPHRIGQRKFRLGAGLALDVEAALTVCDEFVAFLWSGDREPAGLYVQQGSLPTIMTLVTDGTYSKAMTSAAAMTELVERLTYEADRAANMDW